MLEFEAMVQWIPHVLDLGGQMGLIFVQTLNNCFGGFLSDPEEPIVRKHDIIPGLPNSIKGPYIVEIAKHTHIQPLQHVSLHHCGRS